MVCSKITNITAREILDSRGYPTVEVEIEADKQITGSAAVPSGASTGTHEVYELRDNDERYQGKGVQNAVENVNTTIFGALKGANIFNQNVIDNTLICLDGSQNKKNLGANAILGVSLAVTRTAANVLSIPLYAYLGGTCARTLPTPMMNIFNGGVHASNNIDIQEFMVMPVGAKTFAQAVQWCSDIYHSLQSLLKSKGMSTSVGDEGGFASCIENEYAVLELLCDAIAVNKLIPGKDVFIALDAAAADWVQPDGSYTLPKKQKKLLPAEMISYWTEMAQKYPIISIEDPLGEDDFNTWHSLTAAVGGKLQLVGDDLFTTNKERLCKGIEAKAANAILIKVNQIGTLTESLGTIFTAKNAGYEYIISHRSGETEDTFIADLSVGVNANQIKTGAPCRSERTAKYNRLMKIELELGKSAHYAGGKAFSHLN